MKKHSLFLMLIITILSTSCDKCNEGNKPTPSSFFVEVLDETTSENVFENETFTAQQITIKDVEDKNVPFNFIASENIIQVLPSTQNQIDNTFVITLNNQTTLLMEEITLTYAVSEKKEECFTTYKIENVQVPNNPSEFVNGIYVIKL